jgi:hypothetical protein
MTMPNFLIIGAMKSGTTALYYYLEQHPEIYMSPVKEPNFFSSQEQENAADAVTNIGTYQHLFRGGSGKKALGEASHSYLYEPRAAAEIKRYVRYPSESDRQGLLAHSPHGANRHGASR